MREHAGFVLDNVLDSASRPIQSTGEQNDRGRKQQILRMLWWMWMRMASRQGSVWWKMLGKTITEEWCVVDVVWSEGVMVKSGVWDVCVMRAVAWTECQICYQVNNDPKRKQFSTTRPILTTKRPSKEYEDVYHDKILGKTMAPQ